MLIPKFVAWEVQRVEQSFLVLDMSNVDIIKLYTVWSWERLHAGDKETSIIETRSSIVQIIWLVRCVQRDIKVKSAVSTYLTSLSLALGSSSSRMK
jgi:hypothetical protein